MSSRSLNKVLLIGNLTRDPELRYTPQGTAVCSFGLATNRFWTTESNDKREETEFHRVVAWNKLAELCSQLLFKGRKVYIEGRLSTRSWTAQDGSQRQTTEVVSEEMIILDSRMVEGETRSATSATYSAGSSPAVVPMEPAVSVSENNQAVVEPAVSAPADNSGDFLVDDIPDDLGIAEPVDEKPAEGKTKGKTKTAEKAEKPAEETPAGVAVEEKKEGVKPDGDKAGGDIPF